MATEEEKLVERLRAGDKFAKAEDCRHDRCNCAIMDEAADAISRLVGERDARQEDSDTYKAAMKLYFEQSISEHNAKVEAMARATAAEARVAQLETALNGLVNRLDEAHADPRYKAVWTIAQLHGAPYSGPTYTAELAAARTALSQSPDRESGT